MKNRNSTGLESHEITLEQLCKDMSSDAKVPDYPMLQYLFRVITV